MSAEKVREWFEAETGKSISTPLNKKGQTGFNPSYVSWLERRLTMALEPGRSLLIKAKMREAFKAGLSFYDPQLPDDQKDRLFDEWKEWKEKHK